MRPLWAKGPPTRPEAIAGLVSGALFAGGIAVGYLAHSDVIGNGMSLIAVLGFAVASGHWYFRERQGGDK